MQMGLIIAAGLLAVPVCAVGQEDNAPPKIEIRTVAKSTDDQYYAFPSICKLNSGELVCVFYSGTGHMSPDGKIVMVKSSDEGKTWSQPRIIADTPIDDRDPSIMQTRSGRILVNFFVYGGKVNDQALHTNTHVHVCYSEDGGRSFTTPEPIEVGWQWEATSDEILELADGTLLLPIYGRKAGDTLERAAVAFSSDGGRTWNARETSTIAYDTEGKIDFQEPALALLPNGTILCSLRTTNAGYHAYESCSTDGGKTWSKPIDTGLRGHAAGLLYTSSGRIFHAYRSWSEDGKVRGVAGVFGRQGEKWDPAKEFDIMLVGGDVGYPSAVELSDGSIYCVYYAREHRAIEAAIIGN